MKKSETKIDLFTFLNQIQSKRKTIPYDKKIASGFLISLFLSMNKDYLKYVNDINQVQNTLSDEAIYDYYMSVIPQGRKYSKFIKKREDEKNTKDRLEKIQKLYPEMSTRECKMLLSFLTKEKK
jgi:hypothetical protein